MITPSLNLAKVRATITFNISVKVFIIKDAWKFLCLVTNVVTPKLLCRTAAISKMELFVIIVNGFQTLTIITKSSILDVAAALNPPLLMFNTCNSYFIDRADIKLEYFNLSQGKVSNWHYTYFFYGSKLFNGCLMVWRSNLCLRGMQ